MNFLAVIVVFLFSFNSFAATICSTDGPQLNQAKKFTKELSLDYSGRDGRLIQVSSEELHDVIESLEWNITLYTGEFYSKTSDMGYTFFLTCTGEWSIEEYIAD